MIRTVIALPYELARLPLVLADNRLSGRQPATSGPRLTLDRAIGSADKVAGAVLGNRTIARRGAERVERSDKLVAAARLEQQAAQQREQATQTARAGSRKATQQRKAAQETASSGLDEAAVAEVRGKQEAKAKAAKAAAAKKAAATKRAATRTDSAQQRRKRATTAAATRKKAAQRKAKAERDDARKTEKAAAETRADADRLEALTEAKKQERKQD